MVKLEIPNSPQFSHAAVPNSRIYATHPDSTSQATSVSFSGPFTPGSDTFSSAALPGNPELKGKRCRQACSSCSRKKTRCNGSKRHCYYTSDREAQRINQRRIENLKHLVADQDEHISELEAQIAIL